MAHMCRIVVVATLLALGSVTVANARTVNPLLPYSPDRTGFLSWVRDHPSAPLIKSAVVATESSNPLVNENVYAQWLVHHSFVQEHNARYLRGEVPFYVALNKFALMDQVTFARRFLTGRNTAPRRRGVEATTTYKASPHKSIPTSVDWVAKGVVVPIKNQGQCGSCWAFSATANMEGVFNWYLRQNPNVTVPSQCSTEYRCSGQPCCSFSEQEIVDCTLNGADNCNVGGEPHDGTLYIADEQHGNFNTEKQYPYTSGRTGELTPCKPRPDPVQTGVTAYMNFTSGDEQALTQGSVEYPTISVGIDASSMEFQLYSGGIFYYKKCKKAWDELDHAVAVVGFGNGTNPEPPTTSSAPSSLARIYVAARQSQRRVGAEEVTEYYMVRNSWGTDWGLDGYIAMARNQDNMCGIATDAMTALR